MNLNKVLIIGRVTADPQLRSTSSGQQVTSFGVATNRAWTDRSGARREEAEFHNVVVWGKQAEVAGRFLIKGSLVFIEGRLQTRDWEGKDGQKRRTTEIICERLQLGPRPAGSRPAPDNGPARESSAKEGDALPTIEIDVPEGEIKAEDLPF